MNITEYLILNIKKSYTVSYFGTCDRGLNPVKQSILSALPGCNYTRNKTSANSDGMPVERLSYS